MASADTTRQTAASLLSGGVLLAIVLGCHRASPEKVVRADDDKAEAALSVRAAAVQRRTLSDSVDGLGRVEALPRRIATLAPAVEGQVAEIFVEPSAAVKAGQPILRLDATIATADLQEKTTARDALEASLRLLQSLPRTEEQRSRKLAVESAKVALAKAETTIDRLRPLRARGDIPEAQMYEAQQAVAQARLQLQTAESDLAVFMLLPRPAAIEEARARVASASAAVRSAQAKVDLHTLRAPIDGVVDSINCRLGQMLSIGAAVAEIVDARRLDAAVWLPVDVARRVNDGQTAHVRSAIAATGREAASQPGNVVFIGRMADAQTGNVLVRVLVENSGGQLLVGQTVSVTIDTGRRKDVLCVPTSAINDLGEGPLVHVVRQGKAVLLHPQLGMRDAEWVEVLDTDLEAGEPVIVEGGYNLPADTLVKFVTESVDRH